MCNRELLGFFPFLFLEYRASPIPGLVSLSKITCLNIISFTSIPQTPPPPNKLNYTNMNPALAPIQSLYTKLAWLEHTQMLVINSPTAITDSQGNEKTKREPRNSATSVIERIFQILCR